MFYKQSYSCYFPMYTVQWKQIIESEYRFANLHGQEEILDWDTNYLISCMELGTL